ncbi:TPA: hypothetical protein ACMV0V_004678, partial [Salmonella enterica subsp. enterica]
FFFNFSYPALRREQLILLLPLRAFSLLFFPLGVKPTPLIQFVSFNLTHDFTTISIFRIN